MIQMKEQEKTPEEELSKVEISNVSYKEFKVKIIMMLNKLKEQMNTVRV